MRLKIARRAPELVTIERTYCPVHGDACAAPDCALGVVVGPSTCTAQSFVHGVPMHYGRPCPECDARAR